MQHAHQGFFQDNDEDGAMAKYSDGMRGRYVPSMWNHSDLKLGGWGWRYVPPRKFFMPRKVIIESVLHHSSCL